MGIRHPSLPRWAAWLNRPFGWALLAIVIVTAVYSVQMTAAGPWDPWETHYGEVARQIVVRHDPVDLWWQPGNGGPSKTVERSFASKPALPFWCMALSLKVFGVGTGPEPAGLVYGLTNELALRLPSMFAGMMSAAFLGFVVWRLVSQRAGVLTGLILSTMPQWAIVSRQALTDMFFVGPVVLAAGAWALAWLQPDRELRVRGTGWKRVPWDRAYLGFFALFVLAAVIPLAVIHQHAFDPGTWKLIGRSASKAKGLRDIQMHMAIYWVAVVFVFLRSLRWRNRSQCWMGILYLAAGLSLIGKGMIGPGLVGALVLAHLAVSGRWNLLLRCGLPTGTLLFALPAFPWHHAMILFRGDRWVNELIIQNNLQRFSSGEQKQAVGGFAFYLETLGLGALPWSAVIPAAIYSGIRSFARGIRGDAEAGDVPEDDLGHRGLQRFAFLWFGVSLLALSYSTTKYYHYLLPILPPAALMISLWIERRWSEGAGARSVGVVVGAVVALALLVGVLRDALLTPAWLAHLTTYLYTGMWTRGAPDPTRLIVTCLPFAAGLLLWAITKGARTRRYAVGAWVLSGLLTTGYIIADYIPAASENWSQRTAMRIYFDERGPDDRLISWWFYYRGETYLSKRDVWVMKDPDPAGMKGLFEQYEGTGAGLWFVTIESHAKRLRTRVPAKYRERIEEKYRSFHYVMLRIQMD